MQLDKYFDEQTMSVHLREDAIPLAKKGFPGHWEIVKLSTQKLTREEVDGIANEILEKVEEVAKSFLEIQRHGSSVVQLGTYRIVITRKPFSDGSEITAVRPVAKLNFDDYHFDEKLKKRLTEQAEGILIAGAPGEGKTTLARALAEHFAKQSRIVKTVESPRDMLLSSGITQYSLNFAQPGEIHDVLLLSRPDNTFFDEMRSTQDFELFTDLRLAGIGMVGVLHATNPIDAIQRFIGRIEIGIIPQIIDTVVFVKGGQPEKILHLHITVKVPSGMMEADLARPVVEVRDFLTEKLEYEIYSYGEQTVVIPLEKKERKAVWHFAAEKVKESLREYSRDCEVEFVTDDKVKVYLPVKIIPRVIGAGGEEIKRLEKKLGLSIDVLELQERSSAGGINFEIEFDNKNILIFLEKQFKEMEVNLYEEEDPLGRIKSSRKAVIKLSRHSAFGKAVERAARENKFKIVKV